MIKVSGMQWNDYWTIITSPRILAAFRLTFGVSFLAALINAVFGFIVAWVLVRYRFPMRRLVDAMVDLPFAMPTAVSGVALLTLYKRLGQLLDFKIIFTEWGLLLALTFIGLPFVVRTLQPAIEDIERELEEVSSSLVATRWQTFTRVIFPSVCPALITGFSMAFGAASSVNTAPVVFIAGTGLPIVSIENREKPARRSGRHDDCGRDCNNDARRVFRHSVLHQFHANVDESALHGKRQLTEGSKNDGHQSSQSHG